MSAYVPSWPGLALEDLLRKPRSQADKPFPLAAPPPVYDYYYRASNALYHLFRSLRASDSEWALLPDYHHGIEVNAIRAAGFGVRFYPVRRDLHVDLDRLAELCAERPRVLLAIHYLGWGQPLDEMLALCRRFGIVTVEDCALAFLSERDGVALGSRADHAVFCLYKTLPLPNGGVLVHKAVEQSLGTARASANCGVSSVAARTLDLAIERLRGRFGVAGEALAALKASLGRALTRCSVKRWPVGDDRFDLAGVDLRISQLSRYLLERFDYRAIHARRRENFVRLGSLLAGEATPLFTSLPDGVCPLFFPILVPDKRSAARALWARGIGAIEFWNEGDPEASGAGHDAARFLRQHVLELPIHQDLRPEQLEYTAEHVRRLGLRMAA